MKTVLTAALKIAPLVLALAAVATPAMADGGDHRQGRSYYHYDDDDDDRRDHRRYHRDRDRDHARYHRYRDYERRDYGKRYDYSDYLRDTGGRDYGNRYDRSDYLRDIGRSGYYRYDRVRYYDGRNRRYHPVSGHWDNGRRGPPPWARGRDYRSYGYRNVYYVPVSDYGRYRLYRPDYGYRWVRDDRDNFLLVAATTGIIASVLLGHGY